MKEVLYIMRFICAVEGFSGFTLNMFLVRSLIRSQKTTNKLFLVPIYVSALSGIYLCFAIAFMNFTHIFYDGTLAIPLVGPSVQFIPKFWRDLLYEIAFVVMSFMWTLTPSTCILQYTALSRNYLTQWKRLLISFIPTVFCLILIAYTVPMTMPTPELGKIMERTFKELYGMDQDEFLECYGITIKYAEINKGKSLLTFTIIFCVIPYSISYTIIVSLIVKIRKMLSSQGYALSKKTLQLQRQFFVMQILQSFLPLAILSAPLTILMYGVLTGAQLGFWSLSMTVLVWFCPVVQAGVQLRYVMQSNSSTTESSQVTVTKSELSRRSGFV